MSVMPDSAIGERYDPFGAHLGDPYSFFAEARHEQPVFYANAFNSWVVTRYDDVRHVLMNPELFSSANAIRPMTSQLTPECQAELKRGYPLTVSLLNTDGAVHQRLRAPFTKGLGLKRAREFEPAIRRHVDTFVDAMVPAGRAEYMREFAHPLPFRILAGFLGIDEADHQAAQDGSFASSRLYRMGALHPDEQLDYARRSVRYQQLLIGYAAARRAEPRDDLLSLVVAEWAPGREPLTFEQECELFWSISGILGSTNSMASALGMGLYHLLRERDKWELLVARPGLIGNAIEEICRYDPPAQTFARITTASVTIGGVDLPAGAEVMVMFGSANRDETLVDRPAEFDVTRPRMRHLTFGQGPHICLGAPLVRSMIGTTLQTLTSRLPGLRIADGHKVLIAPVLNHRQPLELPITW